MNGRPPRPPQLPAPGSAEEATEEFTLMDTGQFTRGGRRDLADPAKGFDPYATGVLRADPRRPKNKPTDLRKLSEWIKAQRRAAQNRDDDGDAGGG